jgi:hypothetical protein
VVRETVICNTPREVQRRCSSKQALAEACMAPVSVDARKACSDLIAAHCDRSEGEWRRDSAQVEAKEQALPATHLRRCV